MDAPDLKVFEVTMVNGQRWLVREVSATELDRRIQNGGILPAKVPLTMGDKYKWRINTAHIVAYQPEEDE